MGFFESCSNFCQELICDGVWALENLNIEKKFFFSKDENLDLKKSLHNFNTYILVVPLMGPY